MNLRELKLLGLCFIGLAFVMVMAMTAHCQLYQGINTTTVPVGTLTPPFTATTPYNTCINTPPSGNPLCLLTDANWKCNKLTATNLSESNVTPSGGDNDPASSVDGTYIIVHVEGANCFLHLSQFLNVTAGGENACMSVPGQFAFSKVIDAEFYWLSDSHLLHQGTITSDCTFTETVSLQFPFDFDRCPGTGITPGTKGTSASIIGVSFDDRIFSVNLSWTGNQGTSHMALAYEPGVGCATLNTATGTWYGFGSTTLGNETGCLTPNFATGKGIHDSQLTNDGGTMIISGGAWNFGSDNFCFWAVGTANAIGVAAVGNGLAGHESATGHFMIDADNPNPNIRLVSPLSAANVTTGYTVLNKLPLSPGGAGGYHGAQPHPMGTDLTPWIIESAGATDGTSYLTPEYLQNEIFGLPTYGSNLPIMRFGETYNSGLSGTFGGGYGIGFPLQPGNAWVFLTDSLLNLGLDTNGKPLSFLAILKLTK